MRQLQEIAITLSLSLNSFILLLLSLFGAISTIWKDIEKRHAYTILSYPIARWNYLLGRYLGFVFILLIITLLDFTLSVVCIKICSSIYKSELPILWGNIFAAFIFCFLKYSLLLGIGFLFACVSTSFFTPIFSTITIFIAGNSIQGIVDYITKQKAEVSIFIKTVVKILYYVVPNFSAFDLTAYASYSLPLDIKSIMFSIAYFILYLGIIITLSIIVFSTRDLN
ncbi:MAG: hypothetical protein Q9M37_01825 [Desulfonauticus sp.]|nr:hypothetical protein [Desulfonauticus sp.]